MCRALSDMGHPQPPIPIQCDNKCAVGITTDTIKQQRSQAMDSKYFWVQDQQKLGTIDVKYQPGSGNLGDFASKHHSPSHCRKVRKFYSYTKDSPTHLKRALAPSLQRGCVKPLHNLGGSD